VLYKELRDSLLATGGTELQEASDKVHALLRSMYECTCVYKCAAYGIAQTVLFCNAAAASTVVSTAATAYDRSYHCCTHG
jgi:hypothetical protein